MFRWMSKNRSLGPRTRRLKWRRAAGLAAIALTLGVIATQRRVLDDAPRMPDRAAEPLWRFGFVGDTHADFEGLDRALTQMADRRVRFVVHLGDMVDDGGDPRQWRQFHAAVERHRLPLLPVVGNHDVDRERGDAGRNCFELRLGQFEKTYYQRSFDGVQMVVLNSEESLLPGTAQWGFFRRALQTPAVARIVCLHRPVFTSSKRDWANVWLRRQGVHPLCRQGGVHLVLSGHNHYYERTRRIDGVTYLVSGGGAPNQYAPGNAAAFSARLVAGRPHFGIVEVFADRLRIVSVDATGHEFDDAELPLDASNQANNSDGTPLALSRNEFHDVSAGSQQRRAY